MNNPRARANRMYVRRLLEQKQPGFAAALESVAREFAPGYEAPGAAWLVSRMSSTHGISRHPLHRRVATATATTAPRVVVEQGGSCLAALPGCPEPGSHRSHRRPFG